MHARSTVCSDSDGAQAVTVMGVRSESANLTATAINSYSDSNAAYLLPCHFQRPVTIYSNGDHSHLELWDGCVSLQCLITGADLLCLKLSLYDD